MHEDDSFVFDHTVNVVDVDSGSQPLSLRLKVDYGSLTLPVFPSNLTLVNGTGDRDSTVQLSGPLSYLNIALASMIYTPPHNWHSLKTGATDVIHFLVDDNGHSGGLYDQGGFKIHPMYKIHQSYIDCCSLGGWDMRAWAHRGLL